MNLKEFMLSGKEVYEVTLKAWVEIKENSQREYYKVLQETNNTILDDLEERLYKDRIEAECFHKEEVINALEEGKNVPQIVLNDYSGLLEKIEEDKRNLIIKENSKVLLYDVIKDLKENTKIIIDSIKMTFTKIENNYIVCKPYRKRNKIYKIKIDTKVSSILVGWK